MAEALRSVLLDPAYREDDASPMTEALILAAARRNHVEQKINPALASNKWVLCDRFIDSTRAYQGEKIGALDMAAIEALATAGVIPSLTFLLDAAPAALIERRQQRGQNTDRFERRSLDYHNTVRQRFLDIAEQDPERIIVLDALQTPESLINEAINHLSVGSEILKGG